MSTFDYRAIHGAAANEAIVSPSIHVYQVYDRHTGDIVGKPYSTRAAASRRVDKLDNAYGAYRYGVRSISI